MSKPRQYKRRMPFREPGKRFLVITEGTVTEPRYFGALLSRLQISPRTVVVRPACGSDPMSVVDTAIDIISQNRKTHDPAYDKVWVVFDTEAQRIHLPEAIAKAQDHGFNLAISAPSIEYWFLLHFEYTTRYMIKCQEVERELRNHFDYSKGRFDFLALIDRTDTAVINARQARQDREATSREFPATDVDLLVTEVNALANGASRLFHEQ